MWVVPRTSLTEDQLSAVQMSTAKHRVVVGGPGSGKTLVLAHRARQLLDAGMRPDRLRLLVFTKVLSSYIERGLDDLGVPREYVSTFDAWCLALFDSVVRGPRPRAGRNNQSLDFSEIRGAVLAEFHRLGIPPMFDAVLVDEGQDLDPTAIQLLHAAATHVTLALDSRQQLYATGMDVETACSILQVPRAAANLLTAYRCTPLIVDLAAEFLPPEDAGLFRAANLLSIDGVETPVLFTGATDEAEMDELAMHLGERAMLGHSTAVLVPTRRAEARVIRALSDRNIRVGTRDNLAVGDLRPIVLTYHSAKGLTVDDVFLPGLTNVAFRHRGGAAASIETMLFVGITRATRWAWLGTRAEDALDELERLESAVQRRTLLALPRAETTFPAQVPTGSGSSAPRSQEPDLRPGDRVTHDRYGEGTVIAVEGTGASSVARITFEAAGVKRLLLLYSPVDRLEPATPRAPETRQGRIERKRPVESAAVETPPDLADLL
ncbi:MAG: hypothetical protein EOL91_01425 [Actinobacteria bacterium]|nr:hypothetical protein [Actinomycetota bacterium]